MVTITATSTITSKADGVNALTATATATVTTSEGINSDNSAIKDATVSASVNTPELPLIESSKNVITTALQEDTLVNPILVNPFYPLTLLEQTNISNHFLTNILQDLSVPDDTFFDLVALSEPKKADIILFQTSGVLPARIAEVGVYTISKDLYQIYEVVLQNEEISDVSIPTTIPKKRASYNNPENNKVLDVVFKDEGCREALRSKGLTDYDIDNNIYFDVALDSRLDIISDKYGNNFSDFIHNTKPRPRVWFLTPFWSDGSTEYNTRPYIQPIGSLIFFVNGRTSTVMKIYDSGTDAPIQKGNCDYERPLGPSLTPIITTLPQGPSYTVKNNVVQWADWNFTLSTHPVTGVALYNVSFLDRTVWKENPNLEPVRRSILYKANLSELITSYGDASISGSVRNFYDLGEYPIRDFSVEVFPGIDIPEYGSLFEYIFTDVDGKVNILPNRVGIYERAAGMLWRHTDALTVGRSGRELVITYITVISNYDYLFNWVFTQDGEIHFEIIPSGVIECDATALTNMANVDENKYEALVLPNVYGFNHSHTANVRLDFAVDGDLNKIEENDVVELPVSEKNPYGNVFVETSNLLTTEKEAIRDSNYVKSRKWVVQNEFSKNYLGYERGYEIVPFPTPLPFKANERIIKRASFLKHSLHVTRYHDNELYAVGKNITESEKDTGLAVYVADDEAIVNEDIVVWYTFGFSHTPRIEDIPSMPREPLKFKIIPHNFFNENPAFYIPKTIIESSL